MKVIAIANQNFRGILTGKTLIDHDEYTEPYTLNERFYTETTDTYSRDYYPFAGEKEEAIKEAIRPFEKTEFGYCSTYYNQVNIKQALPFTKEKFMQYIHDRLLTAETAKIRDWFVTNNLQCFIKENFLPKIEEFHII